MTSNGLRAVIKDGEIIGIEATFKGKTYFCEDPCDENGDDRNDEYDNAPAFKMVETTYKGRQDQKVINDIETLSHHPQAYSADYEDVDGDYVHKVFFLLSDVDNQDEIAAIQVHTS